MFLSVVSECLRLVNQAVLVDFNVMFLLPNLNFYLIGFFSELGRSLTWTAQYNTKRPKKPALTGKPSFDVSLFGSPVAVSSSLIS